MIKNGLQNTSDFEKGLALLISLLIAKGLSKAVENILNIDSFILSTFISILTIYGCLALYFYIKGRETKK
ncbi:hypothetical protein [Enterococcus durans]|uniref:hypothetical protein n=1 Tax=Enterococcus durans TaxID=53345 RepID=UPI0011584AC7|nr:hypothetical protein [Enterococcus durans]